MNALTDYASNYIAGAAVGYAAYLAIDKHFFSPGRPSNVSTTIKVIRSLTLPLALPAIGSGLATAVVSLIHENSYKSSFVTGAMSALIIPITYIASLWIGDR